MEKKDMEAVTDYVLPSHLMAPQPLTCFQRNVRDVFVQVPI